MSVRFPLHTGLISTARPVSLAAVPAPKTLSGRLALALERTRSGALRWQRKQTKRPGLFSTTAQIEDCWESEPLLDSLADAQGTTYTLVAHYPEPPLEDDAPAPRALHRWSLSVTSPEHATPQVLDGQLLSLSALDSPIVDLFNALYDTLKTPVAMPKTNVGVSVPTCVDGDTTVAGWLPVLEQLQRQVLSGSAPVSVTVMPASAGLAGPLAGAATVVQIGQVVTDESPRLEITQCGEWTQLVLRTVAGIKKQRWMQPTPLSDTITALVSLAQASQKAAQMPSQKLGPKKSASSKNSPPSSPGFNQYG